MTSTGTVSFAGTVLVLAFVSVLSIGPADGPYHFDLLQDEGLRRGTAVGIGAFVVLLGVLAAQCSRIGATSRDRRLASYRLAGATPRDVRVIVALESTTSSAIGSLAAIVGVVIGRGSIDRATTVYDSYRRTTELTADTVTIDVVRDWVHLLPADVDLTWWIVFVAGLAFPVLVGVFCLLVLRKVVLSPFGVARLWPDSVPQRLPAISGAIGVCGLASFSIARTVLGLGDDVSRVLVAIIASFTIMTVIGLVVGTAAIAATIGRLLAERTNSVSVLLAARRLEHAPYVSSRSSAVVLCVLLVAGFTLGFGEWLSVAAPAEENDFYDITLGLVNVVLAAAIVLSLVGVLISSAEVASLGRSSAVGLVAAGVSRASVVRALLLQSVLPLVVMAPIAVGTGIVAARGILGTTDTRSLGTVANERLVTTSVQVPWGGALLLTVSCIAAAVVVSSVALASVRTDLDIAAVRTTN